MYTLLFFNINLISSLFSNTFHYYKNRYYLRINDEICVGFYTSKMFRIFIDTTLSIIIRIVIF